MRIPSLARSQSMTETIILVALVGVMVAGTVLLISDKDVGIPKLFWASQSVIASPL